MFYSEVYPGKLEKTKKRKGARSFPTEQYLISVAFGFFRGGKGHLFLSIKQDRTKKNAGKYLNTVDGKKPAPVEVGSFQPTI